MQLARQEAMTGSQLGGRIDGCICTLKALFSRSFGKSLCFFFFFSPDVPLLPQQIPNFCYCLHFTERMLDGLVVATSQLLGSILISRYCLYGVLHVLLTSVWASSGFSGFLATPKNMHVEGLAMLNCP